MREGEQIREGLPAASGSDGNESPLTVDKRDGAALDGTWGFELEVFLNYSLMATYNGYEFDGLELCVCGEVG